MFQTKTSVSRLLPVALILIVFAATASAATAATVTLGTPTLTGRVAITEPITVTCSPFDPSLTLTSETIYVQVEQAAGTAIAHGSAVSAGFLPALQFPCDGIPTTIPITINADSAGPPFHGGNAVFTASVTANAATPCFPGSTTCFISPSATQSANAGPTALNMH